MFNSQIRKIVRNYAEKFPYKGRVVDLGCGTAPYKKKILEKADEYIGVDWEGTTHDKKNIDVFADLTKPLPFDENYADTIICFQVLEHLPEPSFFLSECYRILKPQGSMFILVPFMIWVHEAPFDYYRYTKYGLDYLLKKNGFNKVLIQETTGFWQMWVNKFNYHTFLNFKFPLKYLLYPIWYIGQKISPYLDKSSPNIKETAGYAVIAKKNIEVKDN